MLIPETGRDYSWFNQLASTELISHSSHALQALRERGNQMRHMVLWYVCTSSAVQSKQLILFRFLAASWTSCCRLDGRLYQRTRAYKHEELYADWRHQRLGKCRKRVYKAYGRVSRECLELACVQSWVTS
jgi:hypothetical protein